MPFYFAEQFGRDYATQQAEIARLRSIGKPRRDALNKARAILLLAIDSHGKPRRGEPARIAARLKTPIKTVRRWIEDYQRLVDHLVDERCVLSRMQGWHAMKNRDAAGMALELGIERSRRGRHAGARSRRRSGW